MRLNLLLVSALLALVTMGCTPITKVSGYVPPEEDIEALVEGISSKQEIIQLLGEPLSHKTNSNTILYIRQKVETLAFLKPQVTDRAVLRLSFDKKNILLSKEYSTTLLQNPLVIEKKFVASEGRQLTFWEQMFGNIGNFSSEQFLN